MKKDYSAAELEPLLTALRQVFEQVDVLDPARADSDSGLCISYEKNMDDICGVIRRNIRVDGTPRVLRIAGVMSLADAPGISARELSMYREALIRDPLTGIYNRVFWADRICGKLEQCSRTGRTAAMALVEVDGYDQIAAQHGSADAGQLVCYVANQWKRFYDEGDEKVVCRMGDHRFVVVCFGATELDLESQMRFVYEKMNRVCISTNGMLCRIPFTLSIACAGLDEAGCSDADSLYSACRKRLDAVIAAGGNAVAQI